MSNVQEQHRSHGRQNFVYILPIDRHDDTKQLNTTKGSSTTLSPFSHVFHRRNVSDIAGHLWAGVEYVEGVFGARDSDIE